MINGKTVLAVIPARGGSKRCPRKNIRLFRGLPLLSRAILSSKYSAFLDLVAISTDDADIRIRAEFSIIEFPKPALIIDRPAELATDEASCEDVMRHALSLYPHDYAVLLQPTSPLRTSQDIDASIELAIHSGKPCISYSTSLEKHGGKNGAVYVASSQWLSTNNFSSPDHVRYVMPDDRSIDIDLPEDFDAD